MKGKKLSKFLSVLIFLICGELVVRLEMAWKPFEKDNVALIPKQIGVSEEFELLNHANIPEGDSVIRIMIIGDSYLYGGGIEFEKNFGHQLKRFYNDSHIMENKKAYVLDVTRPSNNTQDNYNTYLNYVNRFRPDIVILGYNINDIEANTNNVVLNNQQPAASILPMKVQKPGLVERMYGILHASAMVGYSLHNTHKYLKSKGIIVPHSLFDLTLQSYAHDEGNWRDSKRLMAEMIQDAASRNSQFVAILLQPMDLIQYPELFSTSDSVITRFFTGFSNVDFINMREVLKGQNTDQFVLSKYDEHPNEKGHLLLARYVFNDLFVRRH